MQESDHVIKTPSYYYKIGQNTYCIEETINTLIQSTPENKTIYGWTIEVRWHGGDGLWCPWLTHPNNKIYNSLHTANEAALSFIEDRDKSRYEFRIKPLFTLNDVEWREFKIEKLLKKIEEKDKSNIEAWKVKEDVEVTYGNGNKFVYKKGTLFIKLQTGHIIDLKNSKTPTGHSNEYQLINNLIPKGLVQEVKLEDEKWSHPHLLKELKIHLKLK